MSKSFQQWASQFSNHKLTATTTPCGLDYDTTSHHSRNTMLQKQFVLKGKVSWVVLSSSHNCNDWSMLPTKTGPGELQHICTEIVHSWPWTTRLGITNRHNISEYDQLEPLTTSECPLNIVVVSYRMIAITRPYQPGSEQWGRFIISSSSDRPQTGTPKDVVWYWSRYKSCK